MRPEQAAGTVGHIFMAEFARGHGVKDRAVAIAAGDLVIHPDGGSVAEAQSLPDVPNRWVISPRYGSSDSRVYFPSAARIVSAANRPDSIAGRMPSPLCSYARPAESPMSSSPSRVKSRVEFPNRR